MKREAESKRTKIILLIGLIFIVAGSFFSSFLTRTIGNISIRELCFENPSGNQVTASVYKPDSLADGGKLPAVILVAGEYENKECLGYVAVELARRGMAVMAIDNQGHGETEISEDTPEYLSINDAAQYFAGISYIDKSRIGVVGFTHFAADMINDAVLEDNKGSERLFAAVLYVAGDPMYTRENVFANLYEGRHVGIVSAKYDDLSHHRELSENGSPLAFSPSFPESFEAISFLNFGRDPSRLPSQAAYSMNEIYRYGNRDNGAIRVIYTENATRSDVYYSPLVIRDACAFFSEAFGTDSASLAKQIWPYQALFGLVAIVGFVLFVMSVSVLFTRTQFFADVSLLNDTDEDYMVFPLKIAKYDLSGKIWFWLAAAGAFVFSACTYMRLAGFGYSSFGVISQKETFALSSWLFICSFYLLVVFYLWFRFYSSGKEFNLVRMGVIVPKVVIGKTILLSVVVALISFAIVFLAKFFFSSDFRFFMVAIKGFSIDRLIRSVWPYMPLMIVFFISQSIFQNTVMYNSLLGKFNGFFTAVFAALPATVLTLVQHLGFISNGSPVFFNSLIPYNEFVNWLIPVQFAFLGLSFISRYVFTRTKNNYLPGLINAFIFTLVIASNTKMF